MLMLLLSHCCAHVAALSSLLSYCHAILLLFPIPLPLCPSPIKITSFLQLSFSFHIPSHSSSSTGHVSDLLLLNALFLAMSPAHSICFICYPILLFIPPLQPNPSSCLHYSMLYLHHSTSHLLLLFTLSSYFLIL